MSVEYLGRMVCDGCGTTIERMFDRICRSKPEMSFELYRVAHELGWGGREGRSREHYCPTCQSETERPAS